MVILVNGLVAEIHSSFLTRTELEGDFDFTDFEVCSQGGHANRS